MKIPKPLRRALGIGGIVALAGVSFYGGVQEGRSLERESIINGFQDMANEAKITEVETRQYAHIQRSREARELYNDLTTAILILQGYDDHAQVNLEEQIETIYHNR